jgi:hypothetical protein
MVGLILIIVGLIVWLAAEAFWIGLALIILGVFLMFMPGPFYGYPYYSARRRPPP